MTAATTKPISLAIDVDTSGLQKALDLVERLIAAAMEARAAVAAIGVPADSISLASPEVELIAGELTPDPVLVEILAELRKISAATTAHHDLFDRVTCGGVQLRT